MKKYEKLADKKEAAAKGSSTRCGVNAALSGTTSLVPLSKAGISIVGAAAGAETIASLPVIGAALTTTQRPQHQWVGSGAVWDIPRQQQLLPSTQLD